MRSLVLLALGIASPLPDARSLVEKVVAQHVCVAPLRAAYSYRALESRFEVTRRRTGEGLELRKERLYQVYPSTEGSIRRLLARDGHPLTAREEQEEDRRVLRELKKRQGQSTRQSEDELKLALVVKTCDLESERRELIDGRPVIVVRVTGKRDFDDRSPSQKLLKHLSGHLWIDEADLQVVRAEASVGKIRYAAGFLATLDEARFLFEQVRVDEGVWLPSHAETRYRGRLYLVDRRNRLETTTFYDYRRFTTDSSVAFGER